MKKQSKIDGRRAIMFQSNNNLFTRFCKLLVLMLCVFLSMSSLDVYADKSLMAPAVAASSDEAKWSGILNFVNNNSASEQKIDPAVEMPERYIKAILMGLDTPQAFDKVLMSVLGQHTKLSKNQEGVLLSLCAYEQSNKRKTIDLETWGVVKEEVGEPDAMNIFWDLADYPQFTTYALYSIGSDQFIFIQKVSGGAHNAEFLVWLIQKTPLKAWEFKLMKIPLSHQNNDTNTKDNYKLIAQKIFYNKHKNQLVVRDSDGVINYKIDASQLSATHDSSQ